MDTNHSSKSSFQFVEPQKCIKSQSDLNDWIKRGESYRGYLHFIEELGSSVEGTRISDTYSVSPVCS